jgi:hypothetical protein
MDTDVTFKLAFSVRVELSVTVWHHTGGELPLSEIKEFYDTCSTHVGTVSPL